MIRTEINKLTKSQIETLKNLGLQYGVTEAEVERINGKAAVTLTYSHKTEYLFIGARGKVIERNTTIK